MKQLLNTSINLIILLFFIGIEKMYCQNYEQVQVLDSKDKVLQRLNGIKESDPCPKPCIIKWWERITEVESCSVFLGWDHLNDFNGKSFNGGVVGASYYNFMLDLSIAKGCQIEDGSTDVEFAAKEIPQLSMLLTPQFYVKCFSVGCGFGIMNELAKTSDVSHSNYQYGSLETQHIVIKNNTYFALRPTIHGFIPIVSGVPSSLKNDPNYYWYKLTGTKKETLVSILLSVGYDIVPKNSELNKWCFAIGVSFHINR